MNRKIFLSFLGTNNYLNCNYYQEGYPENMVTDVKYVQEALIKMYCQNFGDNDVVLLFLTEKAEEMNFWDNGQFNRSSGGNDLPNEGLNARLQKLKDAGHRFELGHKRIKEGFSQDEIWSIFETIADEIQEGDQVIFDITHAFRFLPMMGIVLLNYLKATKNIKVNGIHYGAFEKLGHQSQVLNLPVEERNAPIINLKTLLEFQSWALGVNNFVNFGDVKDLVGLSQPLVNAKLKESVGRDQLAKNLKQLNNSLSELTSIVQTNRLPSLIYFNFEALESLIREVEQSEQSIKPFKQIISLIRQKTQPFIERSEFIWLESARWCFRHNLIQQAYTQLQEGLVNHIIQQLDHPDLKDLFNKYDRSFVSSLLNIYHSKTPKEDWKFSDKKNYSYLADGLLAHPAIVFFSEAYSSLTEIRNDINHAGTSGKQMTPHRLKAKLEKAIFQISELLDQSPKNKSKKTFLLLNLSNHPSTSWPEQQVEEAQKSWGNIQDMPFPPIDPAWDEEKVDALAKEYGQKIVAMKPTAVHIMGELTFCLMLVQKLKATGITCIASTTHRTTQDLPDGTKVSKFDFVRFRHYWP